MERHPAVNTTKSPASHDFVVALTVSALFHLSMVSVFSIVILLPRAEPRQFMLGLVLPEASGKAPLFSPGVVADLLAMAEDSAQDALPPVELPRLEPSVPALRTPEVSPKIRTHFSELASESAAGALRPADSWARFTRELRGIGPTLSQWAWPQETLRKQARVRLNSPVPGIALSIEWMSEPRGRRVLFMPPIASLWRVEPDRLTAPIAVLFTVNAQGKVEDVQTSVEDETGVISELRNALPNFTFEPLENEPAQHGTFFVDAEAAAP
ncbi:MAG: hypothetical protein NTU83_10960 [Candidatus Hydrogenedentes bacterium]|nr:hypothetical protein [Candidatus Hydrogenedentota bacterium]